MYQNQYYQPYMQQPMYKPMEQAYTQPTQTQQTFVPKNDYLLGKMVDDIAVVKATSIPLDGSISYFPLTDGSCIVTKQVMANGMSKTITYKPVVENNEDNVTSEVESLRKELETLKKQFKSLKDSLSYKENEL